MPHKSGANGIQPLKPSGWINANGGRPPRQTRIAPRSLAQTVTRRPSGYRPPRVTQKRLTAFFARGDARKQPADSGINVSSSDDEADVQQDADPAGSAYQNRDSGGENDPPSPDQLLPADKRRRLMDSSSTEDSPPRKRSHMSPHLPSSQTNPNPSNTLAHDESHDSGSDTEGSLHEGPVAPLVATPAIEPAPGMQDSPTQGEGPQSPSVSTHAQEHVDVPSDSHPLSCPTPPFSSFETISETQPEATQVPTSQPFPVVADTQPLLSAQTPAAGFDTLPDSQGVSPDKASLSRLGAFSTVLETQDGSEVLSEAVFPEGYVPYVPAVDRSTMSLAREWNLMLQDETLLLKDSPPFL